MKLASYRLSLDSGWRFHLGDVPMPHLAGHADAYFNAKAGTAWGAAAPDFDNSAWRVVDLPHDWAVEGPFDPSEQLAQGYRPRGIGWYRRTFFLDPADRDRAFELQFDGIASHAAIWVNGLLVHRNFCGYTPALIDLTPILYFGETPNTIAVRVDADVMEGWWYEGAGIYRHVWLASRPPVHFSTYGIYANPVKQPNGAWSIPVEATLGNILANNAEAEIVATLLNPEGEVLQSASAKVFIPSLGQATAAMELSMPGSPRLWSVDDPILYKVSVALRHNGCMVDENETPCGFRTLRFDADHGFFLNDQPLKLKGTCNHQDHAGVGVAVPDALWDFRIRRLKETGSNACRCAHNPPAPEFLDACDRLGLLVLDENRHFNHTPEYLEQLRLLLRRDRNHPCVFLWSVFNEEPMQGTAQGREMVRRMVAEVRRWDSTRPVTAAMNGGMLNAEGAFEAVDVVGFNYFDHAYDTFHARHPHLPIMSAEDTSAFMTRGEFANDANRNVISSYDTEHAAWGHTHRKAWQLIAERPFLAGGFVWTGFDYRGEPQRLEWPSVSSVFGIMDLCGFPKTAFFIHQAEWVEDRPVLALAPHWNWPGREGQPIKVIAMTNATHVELWINGRSLGEKTLPPHDIIEWQVPYEAGCLLAIARQNRQEVARTEVHTTGPAVALELIPDRPCLCGDGRDAQPITLQAVDANGRMVPDCHALCEFVIEGAGKVLGHGNGDHNCHDPEQGPVRRLFQGLAQVIVQAAASDNTAGKITLTAQAPGLSTARLELKVELPAPDQKIPALSSQEPPFLIRKWRMAPPQPERPDPLTENSAADMNTWMEFTPGTQQEVAIGQWVLYRATFEPWKRFSESGGVLQLGSIPGLCEVWLDGQQLHSASEQTFQAPLPPSAGPRELTLLLRSSGLPLGITTSPCLRI